MKSADGVMKRRPALRSMRLLFSLAIVVGLAGARGAGEQVPPDDPLAPLARGSLEVWVPDTFFTGAPVLVTRQYQWTPHQWTPLLSEFQNDFPGSVLHFNIMDRAAFVQAIHSNGPNPRTAGEYGPSRQRETCRSATGVRLILRIDHLGKAVKL
jgi:hypothetical protein